MAAAARRAWRDVGGHGDRKAGFQRVGRRPEGIRPAAVLAFDAGAGATNELETMLAQRDRHQLGVTVQGQHDARRDTVAWQGGQQHELAVPDGENERVQRLKDFEMLVEQRRR